MNDIIKTIDIECMKAKPIFKMFGANWVEMGLTNNTCPSKIYYISDTGMIAVKDKDVVKTLFSPHNTKQKDDYYCWGLNKVTLRIHRLVASYFHHVPYSTNLQVHHLNNNYKDNRSDNLHWCSHEEHMLLEIEAGIREPINNFNIHGRKFTPEQVREMRKLHSEGHSIGSISREFNTSHGTVRQVVRYLSYKDIQ